MKVVVTGASGNVGTSTIEAMADSPEISEIVGLSRRQPNWSPPKTSWVEADVTSSDLAEVFRGADAVVHLAWAIQPARDQDLVEKINVEGSRRVFEAVVAAGVPKLVHASSVGVYSRGPKDEQVGEDWPRAGTPSSFYSRHKVAAEELLDRLEREHSGLQVVRLRPALIFKDEAATGIRRLFAGPFLPTFLLRREILPALPRISGLRFQGVHSRDVGEAYLRAVLADASGAFNIAAEPPLSTQELAEHAGVRTFPLPAPILRGLADVTWRLRLQPTPPGWLDMAMNVPMLSTEKARSELGWSPSHSSIEALEELLVAMREGEGLDTPPLRPDSAGGRVEEVRTGVGARPWSRDRDEQLVKYLTDAHSIERQALEQMKAAPRIAGEESLSKAFEQHREETEGHERRVRERLEELGEEPSGLKDVAGALGGWGMVAFAFGQPDTPGKLVMHAYSYEHMEQAAYELIERLAKRAGDEQTAKLAAEIGAEEKRMGKRLEERFDAAVDASLAAAGDDDLGETVNAYLRDAHALEGQAMTLLKAAAEAVDEDTLASDLATHLEETRGHRERLETLLEERDSGPSKLEDATLMIGGVNLSNFFAAQPDTTTKLAAFAFAFEHLEIAAYELLQRVATRAGDEEVVAAAEQILAEERRMAARAAASWDRPDVPLGSAA